MKELVMQYPMADDPRTVYWTTDEDEWGDPIETQWWAPTELRYGGRPTQAVCDAYGRVTTFTRRGKIAGRTTGDATHVLAPTRTALWPLGDGEDMDTVGPAAAHCVRDLDVIVAQAGSVYGLVPTDSSSSWDLAAAAVALGYYPWRSLGLRVHGQSWGWVVARIGEGRGAAVRRAVLARMASDRRELRAAAKSIAEEWVTP